MTCINPELVVWTPDFSSSGQRDPQWTEVRCRGERLTNALNWVEWTDDPTQVLLCEECGHDGCAVGGYVHISTFEGYLLWTPPDIDPGDEFDAHQYAPTRLIDRHGAVAIPIATWDEWRARFSRLPPADVFPTADHRDLVAAWGADPPDQLREAVVALIEAERY